MQKGVRQSIPAQDREKLLNHGDNAKELVEKLSFGMRDSFMSATIFDKYDAFGLFMDYAVETLQDDLYLICADGWLAARETEATKKNKKGVMTEWEGMLIPKAILENHYFPGDVANVAELRTKAESAEAEAERFAEECADKGEDDPLGEIRDGDKFLADGDVKKKLKELSSKGTHTEEIKAIKEYLAKKDDAKKSGKALRDAENELDEKAFNRYPTLEEEDVKTILIDEKWMPACEERIHNHFENVIQSFASSIVALHDRYKDTLGQLEADVAKSQNEVHAVLNEMGFDWKEI